MPNTPKVTTGASLFTTNFSSEEEKTNLFKRLIYKVRSEGCTVTNLALLMLHLHNATTDETVPNSAFTVKRDLLALYSPKENRIFKFYTVQNLYDLIMKETKGIIEHEMYLDYETVSNVYKTLCMYLNTEVIGTFGEMRDILAPRTEVCVNFRDGVFNLITGKKVKYIAQYEYVLPYAGEVFCTKLHSKADEAAKSLNEEYDTEGEEETSANICRCVARFINSYRLNEKNPAELNMNELNMEIFLNDIINAYVDETYESAFEDEKPDEFWED